MSIKRAYMFDIDGTLTLSRKRMTVDHVFRFLSWSQNKDIFLVTGSDYDKAIEQIPSSVISRCQGIFTSMGNVYHENQTVIYSNEFQLPEHVRNWLDNVLKTSKCPKDLVMTKHYELRPGMINFSICGRDVTQKQRKEYDKWDKLNNERTDIVTKFNKKFNEEDLEACLGGEISIDIQPTGKDKRQSVEALQRKGYNEFIFFGDRAYPGGNDWGVCEYIVSNKIGTYYTVNGPNETVALLSEGI